MKRTPPLGRIRSLETRCRDKTCPWPKGMCELALAISEAEELLRERLRENSAIKKEVVATLDKLSQLRLKVCPDHRLRTDTDTGTDPLYFAVSTGK